MWELSEAFNCVQRIILNHCGQFDVQQRAADNVPPPPGGGGACSLTLAIWACTPVAFRDDTAFWAAAGLSKSTKP